MAALEAVGVVVIVVLAVFTVVTFVVVCAATVLVAGAVRAEERQRKTPHYRGRIARLVRWLLFVSRLSPAHSAADPDPEEKPAWYQRAA